MHRIDTSTKAPDLFGAGKHGFRDGDPQQAIGATRLNAAFFNAVQEELARICEAANVTLDAGNHEQVLTALRGLFLGKTAEAADSARLGGQLPGYYAAVLDAVPPGFVGSFAMAGAPTGWLKANGAAVSRAAYSRLFAVIGTTFGAGDGSTTFSLPDLRGEFVRGWDDKRGVDNSRVFGSAQADALQGHGHELLYPYTGAIGGDLGTSVQTAVTAQVLRNRAAAITDLSGFGAARASSETRGRNVALLACIKY
ncbi:phage tail protein [Laribacter hongkongensis]|uniref:phage tail protein n=1 Tax=Laribacter hongkongensis TaxID=168471 RepID=UPI001EFEAD91|nr:phage tail protein [Laribacter hongkongensis]MCG9078930.1 tail fiber protein [Laribacter hongkongensis]